MSSPAPDPALVLGTAQFGSDYGVTNAVGRVTDEHLHRILEICLEHEITSLDTSVDYGDAQLRLAPWSSRFAITTKVKATDPRGVSECLESALVELGVDCLDGVLVHDWHTLNAFERERCASDLEKSRARGIVRQVGVSGYEAVDLDTALGTFGRLDLAQLPTSALDQRLADAPEVAAARAHGTRLQARSLLLQGYLAAPGTSRHPDLLRFFRACREAGAEPKAVALGWVRAQSWVEEAVVGVTSATELLQILRAWEASRQVPAACFAGLGSTDLELIDPRRWR